MEEPGWGWPSWKFGMKRDELFGRLNDQYNTFSSPILDPEAFHSDVYEISNEASSADEFHRLMAERKQQRLRELNDSLESAAVEIIANPKLIGTDKWQFALQLFRTRSLDSLIRYFSSYLPEDYMSSSSSSSTLASSAASTTSSMHSSFDDCTSVKTTSTKASCFFSDDEDAALTHEPLCVKTADDDNCPSLFEDATDTSASSPTHLDAMSFSGSDSEPFVTDSRPFRDDESHAGEVDSPISVSDLLESQVSLCPLDKKSPVQQHVSITNIEQRVVTPRAAREGVACREDEIPTTHEVYDDDEIPPAQLPTDDYDCFVDDEDDETPTPHQDDTFIYLEETISIRQKQSRSSSPAQQRRRAGSPPQGIRRSPEETLSRIHKPLPDARGLRPALARPGAK